MSSLFGGSVQPSQVQPYVGSQVTQNVLDAIINTAGVKNYGSSYPTLNGITPYGGQINPDINQTILPNVYGSWAPWMAGESWQATQLAKNPAVSSPMSYTDPNVKSMIQWGGTGGPGNKAMSLMMQYGAPSQAGQYMANMAQSGISSTGAGQPLADLAYGRQSSPALAYLQPFMMAKPYQAPAVP